MVNSYTQFPTVYEKYYYKLLYVSVNFLTLIKYLRKTTSRKKDIFWLKVPEVLVCGGLNPLFLRPMVRQQCHDRRAYVSGSQEARDREKVRDKGLRTR